MKLKAISEDIRLGDDISDVDDVVERIEQFVTSRRDRMVQSDVDLLTQYLSRFSSGDLHQVAALLGSWHVAPKELALDLSKRLARFGRAQDQEIKKLATQSFSNHSPISPAKVGGTPNNLSEALVSRLVDVSASTMIDNYRSMPRRTQPFIYDMGLTNRLYVGEAGHYHESITNDLDGEESTGVDAVYYGSKIYSSTTPEVEVIGAIGRIGYGFSKIDESLSDLTMIAVYYTDASQKPGVMSSLITKLIAEKYAPADACINYGGKLLTASEMVGGAKVEISSQDKLREEYQIAYHLGTWPDGRRMSPTEKRALGKKLGIFSAGMKKHPWQDSMEKAKVINPGQRWWAPHSESFHGHKRRI